jgi:hypothetical protein
MRCLVLLVSLVTLALTSAFAPRVAVTPPRTQMALHANKASFDTKTPHSIAATASALVTAALPLVARAAEEYEYGAVDAPIGLAWAAGILAILTAAIPVLLRPGEEAFEQMRERDSDSFGSKSGSTLDKRKK